jgi:predicted RNA-binding protein YlxR (DUF448 family)
VVGAPGGGLAVGRTLPGRGAWLCPDVACVRLAQRRRAVGRALRRPVDDAAVEQLAVAFGRGGGTLVGRTPTSVDQVRPHAAS